jgi:hypothetical protein
MSTVFCEVTLLDAATATIDLGAAVTALDYADLTYASSLFLAGTATNI